MARVGALSNRKTMKVIYKSLCWSVEQRSFFAEMGLKRSAGARNTGRPRTINSRPLNSRPLNSSLGAEVPKDPEQAA